MTLPKVYTELTNHLKTPKYEITKGFNIALIS